MTIRKATIWEAKRLLELWEAACNESWVPWNGYMNDKVRETFYLKLLVKIKNPNYLVAVAEEDEKIVGFVTAYLYEDEYSQKAIAHWDGWYVEKDYRKLRIGSELFNLYVAWAKQSGAAVMELSTVNDEKLINIWKGKGFEPELVTYMKEVGNDN